MLAPEQLTLSGSPAPGSEPARAAAFEVAQQQRLEELRGAVTLRTARGQLQSLLHAAPQAGRQDRGLGRNGFILLGKPGGLWDSAPTEWTASGSSSRHSPISPSGSDIPASEGAGQGSELALPV